MARCIFLFFFLLLSLLNVSANDQIHFKRITTNDGLSNNWVRCILQDSTGYMWFGTADGLNRFDGKNIKVFRPLSNNHVPIGNFVINEITSIDSQNFWLCTELGLFKFNEKEETFVRDSLLPYYPYTTTIKDSDQNIWFGSNRGIYKVSPNRKLLKVYTNNPSDSTTISDNFINTFAIDSKGNLWIGTKKGLNKYNKASDNFTRFMNNSNSKGEISGNDITSIFEDNRNRIWIGTSLDGLNLYTPKSSDGDFKKILSGSISSIYQVNKDNLWIGLASGGGISVISLSDFDKGKLSIQNIKNDPLDHRSLGDNSINKIYSNKYNDLWIMTFGGGVNYYSARTKKFNNVSEKYGTDQSLSNNLVNAFFEEEKYLWIGTEAGLDRLDKKTGKFKNYNYNPNNNRSLASNSVNALNKDSKGNLWVGTWAGGLHLYNYKTDDFTRFTPDGKPGSIGSTSISSIFEDSYGNLWIGTNAGGLNRYNYKTGEFKKYFPDKEKNGSLGGRSMSQVYQTSNGNLYIALFGSIDRYDYKTDQFTHISPKSITPDDQNLDGIIIGIFEDSRKNIWITSSSGLWLFDSKTNTYRCFSSKDGLPDNSIQGILEDGHGNLWISTNNGIAEFINGVSNPQKPIFRVFTVDDGLAANDFKKNSAYKNNEGFMFFGSSKGYTSFHPDSIKTNTIKPNVVFTRFELLETTPNENSKFRSTNENINLAEQIDLHYPNTDFCISFAALNFLDTKKNQYRYKLDGYDTEWIDAGTTTAATYTNLREGKYTFKVIASNNDGIWNETPKEVIIKIYPPWWRSSIFQIFCILIIVFSSISFVLIRFYMIKKENHMLEAVIEKRTNELTKLNWLLERKQKIILEQNDELSKHRNNLESLVEKRTEELAAARLRAEESDKLKSSFLANMSHEIRTPMNAIIGFSNLLIDTESTEEKRQKYIELIRNNSKQLSVLINDIIDISIIESNKMTLSTGRFNVDSIMKELYSYFEIENKNRLDFVFLNTDSNEPLFLFNDAIRFRQIMVNLLSNAFKYTDKGKIEYGYEVLKNDVRFFVSDTGIGIIVEEKDKIFDQFYKSPKDKVKLYRGTGIGLAICKSLVEQMGGKIWLDSTINVGSTFSFTLPLPE